LFDVEAARLHDLIAAQPAPSPLLNLGSSNRAFREVEQPHIERLLFGPLRAAGIQIAHADLSAGDGVDIVGDILDPAIIAGLKARGFRCVLVANLLEHVRRPEAVAAACEEIVGPGGIILASVPSSYPYHADPIDTFYRPGPAALAGLFARSEPLVAEELIVRSYGEEMRARGRPLWRELARTLWWTLTALARLRGAASRLDRWRWYARPFRVSIALLSVRECAP
jgi:SAM-dependent methyltransferase